MVYARKSTRTSRVRLCHACVSSAVLSHMPAVPNPPSVSVCDAQRVVMTNGFHAVSSPAFKEMAVASAANVAMAVNAFAKKLGAKK